LRANTYAIVNDERLYALPPWGTFLSRLERLCGKKRSIGAPHCAKVLLLEFQLKRCATAKNSKNVPV
jgi:hypothetical protein